MIDYFLSEYACPPHSSGSLENKEKMKMTPQLVNLNLVLTVFIGANCLQSQVSGKRETEVSFKLFQCNMMTI